MSKAGVWESVKAKRRGDGEMKCGFCGKKLSTKPRTLGHIVQENGSFFHRECLNEKKNCIYEKKGK